MIGQMCGSLDHAPGGAGRADSPAFAGVGDQEIVPAVGAAGAGKTVGEDAAFEVAAEFPLGDCGCARPVAILLKRQPGRQVCLHGAIEQRAFGLAATLDGTAQ